MRRATHRMHERVGSRMRVRRSQLQQRLCGALPQRLDSTSGSLSRRSGGRNRRYRRSMWHRQHRALLDRPLLQLPTFSSLRHDEQTGQVPGPPSSLHGRLQPGLRVRRKHLFQRMLRKRRGSLGEKRGSLPPVKVTLCVAHGALPRPTRQQTPWRPSRFAGWHWRCL